MARQVFTADDRIEIEPEDAIFYPDTMLDEHPDGQLLDRRLQQACSPGPRMVRDGWAAEGRTQSDPIKNDWSRAVDAIRALPFAWQHQAAHLLRDVSLTEFTAGLAPVLEQMRQADARVFAETMDLGEPEAIVEFLLRCAVVRRSEPQTASGGHDVIDRLIESWRSSATQMTSALSLIYCQDFVDTFEDAGPVFANVQIYDGRADDPVLRSRQFL